MKSWTQVYDIRQTYHDLGEALGKTYHCASLLWNYHCIRTGNRIGRPEGYSHKRNAKIAAGNTYAKNIKTMEEELL